MFDIVPEDLFLPHYLCCWLKPKAKSACIRCPAPCLLCIQHGYFPLYPQPVPNQGCSRMMMFQSKAKQRSCSMDMGNKFCRHCSQHLWQEQPWEQMKVLTQQVRREREKEILLFLSLFHMYRSKLTRRPKWFTPNVYRRGEQCCQDSAVVMGLWKCLQLLSMVVWFSNTARVGKCERAWGSWRELALSPQVFQVRSRARSQNSSLTT